MTKHKEEPQEQQTPHEHANPAAREGHPQSDIQGNDNASVNPFTRGSNNKQREQNPSRLPGAAPMGQAGKDPGKVTPIRKNPQGNKPMSHDV